MSIIALNKVTFLGLVTDKERLLDDLQKVGCLELIPLNPKGEVERTPLRDVQGAPSQKSHEALKFLLTCPHRRQQVKDPARFDAADIERQVLDLLHRLQGLQEECDTLAGQIEALRPWGDFAFAALEDMAGQRLWFYVVPHKEMKKLEALNLPWEAVRRDQLFSCVVVISENEPAGMPVQRSHLADQPLHELERRLDAVELAIDDAQVERAHLARWSFLFARNLYALENRAARVHAAKQTCDQDLGLRTAGVGAQRKGR